MILEEETFKAYGYYPKDLKHGSGKHILTTCDDCGKVRIITKNNYRALCRSCTHKGNTNTLGHTLSEEHKAKIGAAMKGSTNALGSTRTETIKALMSAAQKGIKHWNYKGGKKVVNARKCAKRKRQLGYTLLMPLTDGEVGHHVTNEYVIGIPADVHNSIGGRRQKHRVLVLEWLRSNNKTKYVLAVSALANTSYH